MKKLSKISMHMHFKKLYSFLEIGKCRKWPVSAIYDLVHDCVSCDRDRIITDCELQGPRIMNKIANLLSHLKLESTEWMQVPEFSNK